VEGGRQEAEGGGRRKGGVSFLGVLGSALVLDRLLVLFEEHRFVLCAGEGGGRGGEVEDAEDAENAEDVREDMKDVGEDMEEEGGKEVERGV
jgi:hypothetical protein